MIIVTHELDEFDEIQDPPPEDSVFIFTLKLRDPDEGDTINLSVRCVGEQGGLAPSHTCLVSPIIPIHKLFNIFLTQQ